MLQTKKIEYRDGETVLEGHYAIETNHTGKRPAVLVIHDWSGCNDFACQKAEYLAELGYAGFAVDMYGKGILGETKEEKDAGIRKIILAEQLKTALENLEKNNTKIIIAYEPVWAIGTGDACKPDEAQEVHMWIKEEYKKYFGGEGIEIIYGGSVDAKNVLSYLLIDAISGVLVGSASTKIESLSAILGVAENL